MFNKQRTLTEENNVAKFQFISFVCGPRKLKKFGWVNFELTFWLILPFL